MNTLLSVCLVLADAAFTVGPVAVNPGVHPAGGSTGTGYQDQNDAYLWFWYWYWYGF